MECSARVDSELVLGSSVMVSDRNQNNSTTELAVTGMTCGNCARHVNEAIQSVSGVRSAVVSLDAGQATVRWSPNATANLSAVIHAIEEAGYGAKILDAA